MKQMIALSLLLFFAATSFSKTIPVSNIDELNAANKKAKPGDSIVLKNGTWNNVLIKLSCSGTEKLPVLFRAETPGKVLISGVSQLRLGGNYIVVDGLYFTNGYSPSSAVIDFRISDKELANNCRVTNCVINDFNKPKRMDEDYWVSFSGKKNQLDHCSFINKKNLGVLLAVILDDDRSRENFHSIDHNYFGVRPPLGSNGGEIIRVGVSQHCQFNSNTQVRDNFFEYCDGETEVVSIKSCSNVVSGNVFKECQGSVVLRHGNYNTVTNNLFLGYGKEGTGGVRIINRGQWVINNFFYECRGVTFRSPMAIMNGIPNSPANRYVQVTDAVVMNNSFVHCTPISFCEGSDTERTLPPANVLFANNIFYDADATVYKAFDNLKGFRFSDNKVSSNTNQGLVNGFSKSSFTTQKADVVPLPHATGGTNQAEIDSLRRISTGRLPELQHATGYSSLDLFKKTYANATNNCGAKWFHQKTRELGSKKMACKNADEIRSALLNSKERQIIINLTGNKYEFSEPMVISGNVRFDAVPGSKMSFATVAGFSINHFIEIKGGGQLTLSNLNIDLKNVHTENFIVTDTSGNSNHSNFEMDNVSIRGFVATGNGSFFKASKSTICDSIIINNNIFENNEALLFSFADETDKKGYYNVEKLTVRNNNIMEQRGSVLQMLRSGNDESTLGPKLVFEKNVITNCNQSTSKSMIWLYGTQQSSLKKNVFTNCFKGQNLIVYEDAVRAVHLLDHNSVVNSGMIVKNQFVTEVK